MSVHSNKAALLLYIALLLRISDPAAAQDLIETEPTARPQSERAHQYQLNSVSATGLHSMHVRSSADHSEDHAPEPEAATPAAYESGILRDSVLEEAVNSSAVPELIPQSDRHSEVVSRLSRNTKMPHQDHASTSLNLKC